MFRPSAAIAALLTSFAFALPALAGNGTSGGGDLCEDRIQTIRDDLRDWIVKGGASGLTLPAGVTAPQYGEQMLSQIDRAKIRCVGPGDRGYPVKINGTPKVCRFDGRGGGLITCDYLKFNSTSESGQYVLVHHEYAGLAGIELPNQDDSHYETSNQITDYLVNVVVKKLAVIPRERPSSSFCISDYRSNAYSQSGFYSTDCPQAPPLFTAAPAGEQQEAINKISHALGQRGYSYAGSFFSGTVLVHLSGPVSPRDQTCILAQSERRFDRRESNVLDCGDGTQVKIESSSVATYLERNGFTNPLIYGKLLSVPVGELNIYASLRIYRRTMR